MARVGLLQPYDKITPFFYHVGNTCKDNECFLNMIAAKCSITGHFTTGNTIYEGQLDFRFARQSLLYLATNHRR